MNGTPTSGLMNYCVVMPGSRHTPMNLDVRTKDLRYLSAAKLEGQLPDKFKRGITVSGGAAGFTGGFGLESRTRNNRDIVSRVGEFLEEQGRLTYEIQPEVGKWILLRVFATCGTAWPWAGGDSEFARVAWWVGRSEHFRVVAYGHREHLLNQGKVPNLNEDKATWWPSRSDTASKLMGAVAQAVDTGKSPRLSDLSDTAFTDLLHNVLFEGVRRGSALEPRGVYEMFLRVDGYEFDASPPVLYGSPFWVAHVDEAVPGTYIIERVNNRAVTVASWDGNQWSDLRRNPAFQMGSPNLPVPSLPSGAPDPADLYSLRIRQMSDSRRSQSAGECADGPSGGWKRVLRFLGWSR